MRALIPYFYAGEVDLAGWVTLKVPGLFTTAGAIVGGCVALRKARRDRLRIDVLLPFLPWLFIALLIGSHLGELLFYRPGWFFAHPLSAFEIWSGESSAGALLAAALAGIVYFRRIERLPRYSPHARVDSWRYADALVYGGTLGWAIGRIGCFLVHDHPGIATDFWLGVHGICPGMATSLACHDLGLYEAIFLLACFVVLIVLDRKSLPAGSRVALMALAYGVGRLSLDVLRHPLGDARYFGLTPAQYGAIGLIVLGSWMLRSGTASLQVPSR